MQNISSTRIWRITLLIMRSCYYAFSSYHYVSSYHYTYCDEKGYAVYHEELSYWYEIPSDDLIIISKT